MFMNLAHRGASSYAPENTLAAFYKGIELGANGIETDLRKTKDGVVVLIHDEMVDRVTNGSGKVLDFTFSQLLDLDAGSWFSDKYAGERIISFEEFLHFFGRKDIIFAIELKAPDLEEDALKLINKYGIRDKVTITSFNYEYLKTVREIDEKINIGYLVREIDKDILCNLIEIKGNQICPAIANLEKADMDLARSYGLDIRAWGIKDETYMNNALELGVDGMTINFPDKLARKLEII
ncbi:MAG: glycerophosphodiester phosphodiesterase [Clostridiales bacterium]|nr:glycerophosphodiester phosphodiesterase [Clostridiales bacterium]